jgi:hypothetical protein
LKKVKLFLCLIKLHKKKTLKGVDEYFHAFLTSALDRSEWSYLCSSCSVHSKRVSGIHWVEGWVGPRIGLDTMVMEKNSCPYWESNPGHLIPGLVTILTFLSPALLLNLKKSKYFNLKIVLSNIFTILCQWCYWATLWDPVAICSVCSSAQL